MAGNEKLLEEIRELRSKITELETAVTEKVQAEEALRAANQQLEASNQQLSASEQQLRAVNQQLEASEQQLKSSEDKWKSYVEQAPYGVFIADQEGNYVEVNPAASRITGYTEKELLERKVPDMLPSESRERGLKHFQRLLEKGESIDDIAFRHKSGEIRYWSVSAVKLNEERYLGFVEDITGKKEVEKQLLENQEELSQIIEGSAIATLVIDSEHRVTHWNRACEEMTGLDSEAIRGTNRQWQAFYSEERPILADILLDEKPEKALEKWYGGQYRRSTMLEGVVEVESFFPDLGEEGKWLLFSAVPIRNQEGELIGAVEMLQDVTRARKIREELRLERDLLDRIINDGPTGIVILDLEGIIISSNSRAEEILGLSRSDLKGRTYNAPEWTITDVDGGPLPDEDLPFSRVLGTGEAVYEVEHAISWPDGTNKILSINAAPLKGKSGKIDRVVCSVDDVTERRKADRELKREKAEKELVLDSVHELIAYLDHDQTIQWVNRAAWESVGLTEGEMVGRKCHEIWAGSSRLCEGCPTASVFETGVANEGELTTPDGRVWNVRGYPVKSEEGRVVGAVEVTRDITEQTKAREELVKQERHLSDLLNSITEGVCQHEVVFDNSGKPVDYRILDVNPRYEQILGLSRAEVLGRLATEVYQADEAPYLEIYSRVAMSGNPENFDAYCDRSEKFFRIAVFSPEKNKFATLFEDITERKANEKETRLLTDMIDQVQDFITVTDLEGCIRYINKACATMLGCSLQEMRGHSVEEYGKTPEEIAQQRRIIEQTRERGFWRGEVTNVTSEGKRIVLDSRTLLVQDDSGNPSGMIGISTDITERKMQERILEEREAKYRNLFEAASDGIYLVRQEDGSLAEVNKVACNMLGRTREEILTLTIGDIDPNYPLEGFIEFWKDRPEEEPYIFETTHRRKDGTLLPVEVSGIKYRIGDQVLLYGRARDITERNKSEKKLRDQKAMMARTEKVAHVGSWEWEIEKDCVTWSEELFNIFGLDPALGAPPFAEQYKIYLPEDFDKLQEAVKACTEEGSPYHLELRALRADGEIMDCNVSGAAEKGPDGKINRLYGFLQDISDRKRTEEEKEKLQAQLIQAQRLESVGRLAGGVAHDYNNMLSVILGYTEMALEEVTPDQSVHEDLQEIYKAADRSREITRQLLAFARRETIDPRILEINGTIEGMLNMLERLIGEDIELIWKPGEDIWPVKMDPSQAEQVLANLCINSRDAIDGVGKIVIETGNKTIDESYCKEHIGFLPGEFVMLSVSDDGCGMDSDTLENVFEPFYTTKGLEKGSGLGLATVHGIVKQNGGNIIVLSEVGTGTTFKIFLPRSFDVSQKEESSGLDPIPKGKGERVLLVEDEPSIMKMSKMILDKLGYVVLGAETPEEALQLAGNIEGSLDLLMTDVVMPGMNGRDLADKVQSIFPDIGILFMSGYTAEIIAQRGVIDDSMNFLQKPFSKKALALKVRQALDQ